ncbi:CAP-Gly domain-containing linker protein 4 isoform X3 [Heterocephalus glaber]|uniref:CAP-Gly domain-containing linker protein 4 isoform X3 n=1 Tax=Heterocephalus glaber TaxID=10181 RepID=A0AAX6SNG2_HETGA|nr:CAP-Gly domain-containing linker protein 4 isoform X3 [Heterocephalus glaber]
MTIEDLPDFPLEGNPLLGRYPFLFPGSETPVIFSISAAPMPSDCDLCYSSVILGPAALASWKLVRNAGSGSSRDALDRNVHCHRSLDASCLFMFEKLWHKGRRGYCSLLPQISPKFSFFDPNDASCQEILFDPKTSVSELFAILRQWVPQVQQNIDLIGNEILKRGCNVNDRDGLTDMTLLHYTCKSGAHGIGDVETAVKFAAQLIDLGADVSLRSRWTNMNALHYAAYFDVPEVIRVILKTSKPKDVDDTCSDFNFGTALHIAAYNLCAGAVKCLLEHGANPAFRNDKGQIPADVVPDPVDMPLEMADAAATAKEIKQMLLDAVPLSCGRSKAMLPNCDHVTSKTALSSLGLKLGDRVVIAGQKIGTLRFCGTTEFASGQWAGIELDEPEGKNNGSVGKVQYFKCAPKYGIFAPLSKISKAKERRKNTAHPPSSKTVPPIKPQRVDVAHITSKVNTGLNSSATSIANDTRGEGEPRLGDRVLVVGQRVGTIKFFGTTNFAPGYWYGIELEKPHGKNDGSVGGVQYFSCSPRYGIFAPPSRVQRLTDSLDTLSEIASNKQNHSYPGFRRSFSTTSASSQKEINRRNAFAKSKAALRRSWSSAAAAGGLEGSVKLHEGSHVLLTSSNEMGTVRYVGPTDFASGVWLGLELRSAKGRNDGTVGDKRYFTCKPNHGVLVRPSRVTYRGINGSKLVDENS